jgi:hypothetical protein
MKTAIEITAKGLKSKVSNDEFQSEIKQVADEISLSVNALDQEISSLSVTTSGIRSRVNNIEDGEFNGYTLFEQTGSKFSFTGNVEISGDLITGGTISGSTLKGGLLSNEEDTVTLALGGEISSAMGDMTLSTTSGRQVFQVYDDGSITDFKVHKLGFLSSTGSETYAYGTWNFSGCDVIGISGGSGGTAVAVFG